jgi:hypothetical protein
MEEETSCPYSNVGHPPCNCNLLGTPSVSPSTAGTVKCETVMGLVLRKLTEPGRYSQFWRLNLVDLGRIEISGKSGENNNGSGK